jgi:hypothetical protein
VVTWPHPGLYVGTVRHRRFAPAPHAFEYPLFMALLDIDRLPELMTVSRLTGYNRRALAAFHDADHFGDAAEPLRARLERSAALAGRTLGEGPVLLLTNLRYAGYVFNPISIFYCFDRASRLQAVMAEVNNTFGGRHTYWLDGSHDATAPLRARVAKELYVSPFMPYGVSYDFVLTPPVDRLVVHMNVDEDSEDASRRRTFDATLRLSYRPWTAGEIRRTLIEFPWMTAKVITAIHWEALRLWRKGVPIQPFPQPDDRHRREDNTDGISRFLGRAGRLARVRGH